MIESILKIYILSIVRWLIIWDIFFLQSDFLFGTESVYKRNDQITPINVFLESCTVMLRVSDMSYFLARNDISPFIGCLRAFEPFLRRSQ